MVEGTVATGFERVRAVFDDLGDEAAVCVLVDGRPVVDLWRAPLRPGAVACVYSVTKPFAAFALLVLVDRGAVGLDDPVSRHWPAFGKPEATVRHVLAHQAGVPQITAPAPPEALLDWDAMVALLEREPPAWPPGTAHGEHALTYGHLVGELVRRVDGRSLGRLLADEVAAPWGLDFHVGVPAGTPVVDLVDGGGWQASMRAEPTWGPALDNPPGALDLGVVNGRAFRAAEIPAINGHGSARAIARFYAGVAAGGSLDGRRLVSEELVREALTVQASGPDRLLGEDARWGLGFALDEDGAFGMGGIGGSLGFALPSQGLAYAYVTRTMGGHERSDAVEAAVLEALAAAS